MFKWLGRIFVFFTLASMVVAVVAQYMKYEENKYVEIFPDATEDDFLD